MSKPLTYCDLCTAYLAAIFAVWLGILSPADGAVSGGESGFALGAAKDQVGIAQAGMRSASKELELARERYAVITASSHFELTNALTAVARARSRKSG